MGDLFGGMVYDVRYVRISIAEMIWLTESFSLEWRALAKWL